MGLDATAVVANDAISGRRGAASLLACASGCAAMALGMVGFGLMSLSPNRGNRNRGPTTSCSAQRQHAAMLAVKAAGI